MNIARNEIRTGLLVVFSLAVLVAVVLYLGAPGVFTPMNTYYVYCENAGGLKPGNQVLLAGRRVGQVVKLYSPVPEANRPVVNGVPNLKLETMIEVRVDASAQIYTDVRVYITQNGLLGEMLLDFTSGREWAGLAQNGATFIAERVPGLDQAAPMVLEKIDPALKKLTETLDSLQKTADNLTKLTSDGGDVQQALEEFKDFGTNIKDLTSEGGALRTAVVNFQNLTEPEGNLAKSLAHIEKLTNKESSLARTLEQAEQFTTKLNKSDDLQVTLRNFRRTSENLNNTVVGLGCQLSVVAHNLEQATDTVKRQPWRLIWPSTKKYPEDKKRVLVRGGLLGRTVLVPVRQLATPAPERPRVSKPYLQKLREQAKRPAPTPAATPEPKQVKKLRRRAD